MFWMAVLASAMIAGSPVSAFAQTGGRGSYGLALGGGVISQKYGTGNNIIAPGYGTGSDHSLFKPAFDGKYSGSARHRGCDAGDHGSSMASGNGPEKGGGRINTSPALKACSSGPVGYGTNIANFRNPTGIGLGRNSIGGPSSNPIGLAGNRAGQ